MYGEDVLCGISKVPFEIPHKISYPYIVRCIACWEVKLKRSEIYKHVSIFEMTPGTLMLHAIIAIMWKYDENMYNFIVINVPADGLAMIVRVKYICPWLTSF